MAAEVPLIVMPSRVEGTRRILRTRWSIGIMVSHRAIFIGLNWEQELDWYSRKWLYINIMPLPCIVVRIVAAPCSWYPDHKKNGWAIPKRTRVAVTKLKPMGFQLSEADTRDLEHRQQGSEGKILKVRGLLHFVKHDDGTIAVYRKEELEVL